MKVAITGATGLLGKAFIAKYSNKIDVVPISRQPNTPNCIYSDFSLNSLVSILSDVDAVIHLAAQRQHKQGQNTSNCVLDKLVFLAAKEAGIRNVVFTSTRGVYGKTHSPWSETSPIIPNDLYALGKAQSELLALFLNSTFNMKIKCLRVAQVLSENEYKGSMIHTFINKAIIGDDLEVSVEGIFREYLYIDDLLDVLYTSVHSEEHNGIYNVGTGKGISILDIAKCTSKSFGLKSKVLSKPNLKHIGEHSVMNIDLFCETFNWKPKYTFESAMKEIANRVGGNSE